MIKALTNLYNKINPLWGLGGITIVIVGVIIKSTIWFYSHKMDRTIKDFRNESWIKQDSINHSQIDKFMTIVIIKLNNNSDSISTLSKNQRKSSTVMFNLKNYMEHNVATKDGLLEIQDIFNTEKKNNYLDSQLNPCQNTNPLSGLKRTQPK